MRAHLPVLPVLLSLAGALSLPLVGLATQRPAWSLAVASAGAATLAAAAGLVDVLVRGTQRYPVGGWSPPWGIELVLDPLSAFMATSVSGVSTLALLGSGAGVAAGVGAPVFYALALIALTGFLGMIASGDLFNVFVFLEIASISSYGLVASGGGAALVAGFRYVVLGTVGASFYLLGVGFLYALTGTLNMADLTARLPAVADSPLFVGGVAFIVIGLAIKMGLFPLHGWLPDAYTYAPNAVSTLLAPVGTKAAAYALARTLLYVLRPEGLPVNATVAWAGGAAVLAGGVMAARQVDSRRLLAYSSVSQLGYIALGLGLANAPALAGAYFHVLNHALMKAALFMVVGAAGLQRRGPALRTLGLGPAMPVTSVCAVVASLSMVGIPPVGGFFSKWYLLQGAIEAGQPLLAAVVLVGTLLALVYMYRLTESVWLPAPAGRGPAPEAPAPLLVALLLLTAAMVAAGLANAPIVTRILAPAAAR